MYCCVKCFDQSGHTFDHISPEIYAKKVTCPRCGADNVTIYEKQALRSALATLVCSYELDDSGLSLAECLKRDWALFEGPLNYDVANQLLSDIWGDARIRTSRYVARKSEGMDFLPDWPGLREELVKHRRYFPRGTFNAPRMYSLLEEVELTPEELPSEWYRARIQAEGQPFQAADMGPPPTHLASSGRGNPPGFAYLYLATTLSTAVAEVRPHTAESVSVAAFQVASNARIIDLRHPRRRLSSWAWTNQDRCFKKREMAQFLQVLSDELANPIARLDSESNYAPSQYVCEFIKSCEFDGVLYRSALGPGDNLVLFDAAKAAVGVVMTVRVDHVHVGVARDNIEDDRSEATDTARSADRSVVESGEEARSRSCDASAT